MSTISRADYDEHRVNVLVRSGMGEQEARRHHEDSYPMATDMAIFELRKRGLDATPWRIESYCKRSGHAPSVVGGTRVWTKEAIDWLAEEMESYSQLTISATYRKELGVSWKEEQAMLNRERARKEAGHAGN